MNNNFISQLDEDFGSDSESQSDVEVSEYPNRTTHIPEESINHSDNEEVNDDELQDRHSQNRVNNYDGTQSIFYDSVSSVSKLLSTLAPYFASITANDSASQSYEFFVRCNEFVSEIHNEILVINQFIKSQYKSVFSELENIVPDPIDYARTLLIIGRDLHQSSTKSGELKKFISGEKILVINMSVLELPNLVKLSESRFGPIKEACEMTLKLDDMRMRITDFVAAKLATYAPNISEIVGSYCAVQLMGYCGGLYKLAQTPSCNIPSIGAKSPVKIGFGKVGIRQKGFLYNCSMVHDVPEAYQKQAMRIVAGKLVLAARVDLSKSDLDGSFGKKAAEEIKKKIEKLLAPPENVGTKALPIPIDKTSKKRGGRRFRKMKQKYEMTELQKAQNRMAFGNAEDTVMDEFGEEIGLGMAGKNSMVSSGNIRNIGATKIDSKLSKKMSKRLMTVDDSYNDDTFTIKQISGGKRPGDLLENHEKVIKKNKLS